MSDLPQAVPLNGFAMHLRRTELDAVAAGLGKFESSEQSDLMTLAEALRRLPPSDRAPAWELAVRRYARHRPLPRAAADIGMDRLLAEDLLERFSANLAAVLPTDS